jgi:hypothetical protein
MVRQARDVLGILLVVAVAPFVYADGDPCGWNASSVHEIGPAADLGDPDAAMLAAVEEAADIGDPGAALLLAVEQEANIGDPDVAMLMAAEQTANVGEWSVSVERAKTFSHPEGDALACYFGPC